MEINYNKKIIITVTIRMAQGYNKNLCVQIFNNYTKKVKVKKIVLLRYFNNKIKFIVKNKIIQIPNKSKI